MRRPIPLFRVDGPLMVFGGPYSNLEATRTILAATSRKFFCPSCKTNREPGCFADVGQRSWHYDRAEIIADGVVHAIGVCLGLIGAVTIVVISVKMDR